MAANDRFELPPVRSASVLLPTFQGARFLDRVLAALAAQRADLAWDVLVVDSGSTDGTLEILERFRADFPVPLRVERIHGAAFDHGDTRNHLAAESAGDLLVYLTQDAIPASPTWLADLVRNFEDPRVGAAYCRNVARPDAHRATALLAAQDPGYAAARREVVVPPPEEYEALGPHGRRVLWNFNDVASAIRRELWRRHPFPRTWFGEDLLMARAILEAGYKVVYDDVAAVEHSHDYEPEEVRARARIDGRFNAEWLDRICIDSRSDAETLARRFADSDREAIRALGLDADEARRLEERLRALRRATFRGLYEGGREAGAERRPATRLGSGGPLKVLFVVHGFPPDTWAGTEVYTLELARALAERGHEAVVLARTGNAAADESELSVREERFGGLRVLRMVHRLEFESMRETYRNPAVERVFGEVLDRERPDVVHFQHLIHFSAGIVSVARDRGLPTVVTCNDYWPVCARVQLIRPDGVRCERNQGLGCLVCLKEKDYRRIPAARRFLPWVEPLVVHGGGLLARLMEPPSAKLSRLVRGRRVRLQRRLRAWRDVRDRQGDVLGELARADLIVAPSRFLRDRLLEAGRLDPHRVVYSDYGMAIRRLERRPKAADPEGRLRVGFVGTLVWYKGVDVLVEAMRLLVAEPAICSVFGAFDPADPFHARLAERARGAAVEFRGRFDNDRLSEVHAEIDVLVVPSVWYENSPITIHEAFLTGTPVVTSDIGGMAELVADGESGRHFRAGDAADLARVLSELARDRPRLAALDRFPTVKSIEENAREMEYRYRALAAVVREPALRGA